MKFIYILLFNIFILYGCSSNNNDYKNINDYVTLEVIVETNGEPSSVKVYKSSGNTNFNKEIIDKVKNKYTFIPAKKNNVPIKSTYRFTVKLVESK